MAVVCWNVKADNVRALGWFAVPLQDEFFDDVELRLIEDDSADEMGDELPKPAYAESSSELFENL